MALFLRGEVELKTFGLYALVQFAGAIVGAILAEIFYKSPSVPPAAVDSEAQLLFAELVAMALWTMLFCVFYIRLSSGLIDRRYVNDDHGMVRD